jgi:hypothetical protein
MGSEENEGLADMAAHGGVVVGRKLEEGGNEGIEVDEEGLGADRDKV